MPVTRDSDFQTAALIECVQDALDLRTTGELQNLLAREGLFSSTELRNLYKWKNGETTPSFRSTMRLLRRAGFLTPEAISCIDMHMRILLDRADPGPMPG